MRKLFIFFLLCTANLLIYSQEITIVTEDFPPYNYEEDGLAKGLSTEVVQAVLLELGLRAEIIFYPWARAYKYAQAEKNYLIYSIGRIPEREGLFQWVGSIAPYNTSLYKLEKRKDITVSSLENAKQFTIGCSLDDVITIYLQEKGFDKLEIAHSDTLNFRMMIQERIDLIAYDEASFPFRIKQEKMNINMFERVFRLEDLSDELFMAFSPNTDPELVRKFQYALEMIKEKGIYDNILKKYSF